MAANNSCFMVNWSLFQNHALEIDFTQNQETMALRILTTIDLLYYILGNIISVFSRALPYLHCSASESRKGWASSPGPTVMDCKVQVPKDRRPDLGLNFWCSSQIICTYLLGICFKVLFLLVAVSCYTKIFYYSILITSLCCSSHWPKYYIHSSCAILALFWI